MHTEASPDSGLHRFTKEKRQTAATGISSPGLLKSPRSQFPCPLTHLLDSRLSNTFLGFLFPTKEHNHLRKSSALGEDAWAQAIKGRLHDRLEENDVRRRGPWATAQDREVQPVPVYSLLATVNSPSSHPGFKVLKITTLSV